MGARILETSAQFEAWLDEHRWFQDCRVLSVEPRPVAENAELPFTVHIQLAYQIDGNYLAHSIRVSRRFNIAAIGVRQYSLSEEGAISLDHCSNGIDVVEAEEAIAFCIDTPAILTVRCEQVSVEELPNLTEIVKPWLSDREVYACVPAGKLPTPAEWIALFSRYGEQVAWHIYGENPRATGEVPETDYRGWFLQDPTCLDDSHQGLFFFACRPEHHGFSLQIVNHGTSEHLWHVAKTILGQFKDVEIRCGNCLFSGPEWVKQLQVESKTI